MDFDKLGGHLPHLRGSYDQLQLMVPCENVDPDL